ncbi:branched-chain amino acid ABC transporter permease [Verticiella sediminum]|uniref:Branched-chain amino acid ABC transporter permease n=2 Tax=Verticiella sediminum TaxID=1247510 RepID=A0A556AW38_9BURK|nr:branched-chain amino acid ABC transporter permease [Verticiella sediminum]
MSAPAASDDWRDGARAGVRAVSGALLATAIWGMVTGIAMVKSGLTESLALTMTLVVYAGSAQLTSLPLIAAGAPLWLIFAAGLVVNLRFVIFAAALQPYFRHLSWPRRLGLGFITTDISFVLFVPRYAHAERRGTNEQIGFFLGCVVPGWFAWQGGSILGIYVGALVPPAWSLEFAAILALLAITVPLVNARPVVLAALAAGIVAWFGQPLPLRLGLAAAVITGIAVGMLAERRLGVRRPAPPVAPGGQEGGDER